MISGSPFTCSTRPSPPQPALVTLTGMAKLIPAVVALITLAPGFAHPGGLDAEGGHHDRKNGGYHYHRGGPSTPAPASATTPAVPPTPTARMSQEGFVAKHGGPKAPSASSSVHDKATPPSALEASVLAKETGQPIRLTFTVSSASDQPSRRAQTLPVGEPKMDSRHHS